MPNIAREQRVGQGEGEGGVLIDRETPSRSARDWDASPPPLLSLHSLLALTRSLFTPTAFPRLSHLPSPERLAKRPSERQSAIGTPLWAWEAREGEKKTRGVSGR
jgi:hypothetical protein